MAAIWPQVAAFQLGTYNNSGACCGPQTRLDINLKAAGNGTLTGDTNVMTLLSNGNVGIGTTSPAQKLEIYGQDAAPATSGTIQNGNARFGGPSSGEMFWILAHILRAQTVYGCKQPIVEI